MIDLLMARRFITALTGNPDTPLIFQTFTDKKPAPKPDPLAKTLYGPLSQHAEELGRLNGLGAGIFVEVNAATKSAKREDVEAVRGNYFDNDVGKVTLIIPPLTILVESSGSAEPDKIHGYWRTVPSDEPVDKFSSVQKAIIAAYGTDKSVHNVNRVMRLPGSWHRKGVPAKVRLVEAHPERVYSMKEILDGAAEVAARRGENPYFIDDRPTAERPVDANAPENAPTKAYSAAARATTDRIRDWLSDRKTTLDGKPLLYSRAGPYTYKFSRCVLNPEHENTMDILVLPSGAIVARCFHNSCGGNSQIWSKVKAAIGGWQVGGDDALVRGDHVELSRRMLGDLRLGSSQEIVHASGHFWRYSGASGIWEKIDEGEVMRRVQDFAGMTVGAKGKLLKVQASDMRGTAFAASKRALQPTFFEDAPRGLTFKNGFLRLGAGGLISQIEPHSPDYRATVSLPFDFDPAAPRPMFQQFLLDVFRDDEDREAKIACLGEFVGGCLFGFVTQLEKALILAGSGGNGKSRFVRVITALFPRKSIAAVKPQDMSHEYQRARLVGVRLNALSELPESDILESEAFKAVVSGDAIEARAPYGDSFTFVPQAGHLFAANRLPAVSDFTEGFWRKVIVVSFNRNFEEDEAKDTEIAEKIVAAELPGVAAWAVEGARQLAAQRAFTAPASSIAAKRQWRLDTDPVAQFVDSCTVPATGTMRGVPAQQLFDVFTAWASANGHRRMSSTTFGRRLTGLKVQRRHTETGWIYGLAVLTTRLPQNPFLVS